MSQKIESVLILDGVDKICESTLAAAGIQVTTRDKLTKDELISQLAVHDALIVRSATKVTSDVLTSSCRLKVIGRAGTGVDNIEVESATKKGILVINTPGGNTLSAAEHTCALICALSRSLPQACASLKKGVWDRKTFMGNELFGKTLGIIGLGRIGKEVASRMKAFGMVTVGYDPFIPAEVAEAEGIQFLEPEKIWPIADYITVHTPLMSTTRNLIGEKSLRSCKPTVKIVNVARGGIVDEEALLQALQNGTCGGAALDVFMQEPPQNLSLIQHPKVICTPHLGANTVEAQKRVAHEIGELLVDMSMGRGVNGIVNAPALTLAGSAVAQPWIVLVSSLAQLAVHMSKAEDAPISISLDFYGKEASKLSDILIAAAQVGVLGEMKKTSTINLVNASIFAEEIGLHVTATTHAELSAQFSDRALNSVEVGIKRGSSNHSVTGSVAGGCPILYSCNGYMWISGVSLRQNLILYLSASSLSTFGSIVQALQSEQILEMLTSSVLFHKKLIAVKTGTHVQNLPTLKDIEPIAQVTF